MSGADDPAGTTTWLEHITDSEYRGTANGQNA